VFLCFKRLLAQLHNPSREVDVVNLLDQPDASQIMFPSYVNADKERVLAVEQIGLSLSFALYSHPAIRS
jgi:hypothetical protein